MYNVLLVDDEMPALRFLQAIVKKYANDFVIAQSCTSGEEAMEYLQEHSVDLLVTDISMSGMDGISLSLNARQLQSDIHIVLVTGHADFEYAKGAIQASVDDYILKPVSVSHMGEVLGKIKAKLDEEYAAREPAMLSALLGGQPYNKQLCAQLYGEGKFHFSLVRWGNLGFSQGQLHSTSRIPLKDMPFNAFYGRDEDEQLLFMRADQSAAIFQSAVKSYVMQRKRTATWTILFARNADEFSAIPTFFCRAADMMEQTVVIGRHHYAYLTNNPAGKDFTRHIPNATLKRLEHLILINNARMIKDTFISLAADWEKKQLPQFYATNMVQQLTHFVLSAKPVTGDQQDAIMRETRDLLRYAVSYGDLMASLYSVLFDNSARDKRLTTEDLYTYAVQYIQEKYAQPISIQTVCSEIGISQTYLSRLFRKHGNTSFNSYLTKCRIDNAKQMILSHSQSSLRDIASCVGYDDYAYFSKVFHQMVGCTPSQWATQTEEK